MSEWIIVDDEFPKDYQDVLIFDEADKSFKVAWLNSANEWVVCTDPINADGINYWMPLPDAPK